MIERFQRRLSPRHFSSYREYRGLLKIDFRFRCAYCCTHEEEGGGEGFFEIDHFKPKSKFPELATKYTNLYYSCRDCNGSKGSVWPDDRSQKRKLGFVDPCEESLMKHARLNKDGVLASKSTRGKFTIDHLRLNRIALVSRRRLRRRRREEHHQLAFKITERILSLRKLLETLKKTQLVSKDELRDLKKTIDGLVDERNDVLRRFRWVKTPLDE